MEASREAAALSCRRAAEAVQECRQMSRSSAEALRVEGLRIENRGRAGTVRIVDGVSLTLRDGEMLALVGASGSGKSITAAAIGGLLSPRMQWSGIIEVDGQRMLELTERERRRLRGSRIGAVFQDYQGSFTPYLKLGSQLREVAQTHLDLTRPQARLLVREWLDRVGLPADRVYGSYPFQLSGGQRQRVALAAALLPRPRLLIADEPTTALDVLTGEHMMDLIGELQRDTGCAILFITHDLRHVWRRADRIAVMREGMIVETGNTETIRDEAVHPYTRELIAASPRLRRPVETAADKGRSAERLLSPESSGHVSCGASAPPAMASSQSAVQGRTAASAPAATAAIERRADGA